MVNNNLKEYYIKLHSLYNTAVNMLTALNQSLTSNASEVSLRLYNGDTEQTINIPSFLYIDNKLEQLETSFNNLFEMPKSGEAWFSNTGGMYKLEMVRTNTAPIQPNIDSSVINAGFSNNTFIKDLVNPRTFLKLNINNLPGNIRQMFMRKLVILNSSLYETIVKADLTTYEDYVAALYNYNKGIDYDIYDSVLDLPIKEDKFVSSFQIESIISNDRVTQDNHLIYVVKLDTMEYHNSEDLSETYSLNVGDYLCLGDEYAIYKVLDIDYSLMLVSLEEYVGHISLQTYFENNQMVLQLYNYDYAKYNYIEVPLEENQYVAIFLSNIYNGIRSQLSNAVLLNMGEIYMTNSDGTYMKDNNGDKIRYIDYYNNFCTNIGDLILGLTQTAYPQISNYNAYQLKELTESDSLKTLVTESINAENVLQVLPINLHIFEENSIDNLKNYHTQKTSLQKQLNTLTDNISNIYNQIVTTDWSQEVSTTQKKLNDKLQQYYGERLVLEKQINAVVDEINTLTTGDMQENTKYRVRGVTEINNVEQYIKGITNSNVYIIGIDIEYKYKSVSKNVTSVSNIENNLFTDWNKQPSIDRQRYLVFNENNNMTVEYVNYDTTTNIIKWNQIDVPITYNEDVVIRVRYKLNIGQPFINLYTPWSDEITMAFPAEYTENVEISTIINNNSSDSISARFTDKLINDGYEEHITNKVVANNHIFFHNTDNIYSGFTTPENNMISLYDKLNSMCNDIDVYKNVINAENQKKLEVYLTFDDKTITLNPGVVNDITVDNINHITDYFIRKDMNIVIKNVGEVPINLYSIFPGNTSIPLMLCETESYKDKIKDYQRILLFHKNKPLPQKLGQWIYFRENNIYTGESVLYNSDKQKEIDFTIPTNKLLDITTAQDIYGKDNIQLGMANKIYYEQFNYYSNYLGFIGDDGVEVYGKENVQQYNQSIEDQSIEDYMYNNQSLLDNRVIYMYENITGKTSPKNGSKEVHLSKDTSISSFISNTYESIDSYLKEPKGYDGAFLFVNLENSKQLLTNGIYNGNLELNSGVSVSIPVVFEYFLSEKSKISKRLMFDIRNSLFTNPLNYIIEITAYYDDVLLSVTEDVDNAYNYDAELSI